MDGDVIMENNGYHKACYNVSMSESPDTITVDKQSNSDWCMLTMNIHGNHYESITIRSRDMLSSLHFMLGQLLDKGL